MALFAAIRKLLPALVLGGVLVGVAAQSSGQPPVPAAPVDKWVTVIGVAEGTGVAAGDEALAAALRKAVESTCGVFLKAQSQTKDYKLVYDKIFADTVGFVREHSVLRGPWRTDGKTFIRIRARVSTLKFQKDWSSIAATVDREDNPRLIIAVPEAVVRTAAGWTYKIDQSGTVQSKLEDFFLGKGITLMDRAMAKNVSKRDVMLATIKDDIDAIAAIGARFKAEVVVSGKAFAQFAKTTTQEIGGLTVKMHHFSATLNVRAVQTDSARLLVSKAYTTTITTTRRGSGATTALAKLAEESSPKLLAAIVEAWRKRAHVVRTVQLNVAGMDYAKWKGFRAELRKVRGVRALRLREITGGFANIDVEFEFNNQVLADRITELKTITLEVTEITANRLGLKLGKKPATTTAPAGGSVLRE